MDSVVYFNTSKNVNRNKYDFLCMYLGSGAWQDANSFYSALEKSLKSCDSLPDSIIIYFTSDKFNLCSRFWDDKDQKENFYNRLSNKNIRYTKSIYFIDIGHNALTINNSLSDSIDSVTITKDDIINFYLSGLKNLVTINKVVHIAPAGHTFKHPSGRTTKLFIQSRDIAGTETELQFIGKGLSTLIADINWPAIKTIYIDTMGIYPIVKEAIINSKCQANIESFHSYTSIENLNLPNSEYLIIISASTSGNMAKNLVSRGFNKDKIITLIDIESREQYSKVLIDLSSTNILNNYTKSDGNETDIELVGENFSYKAKPVKQVTLGINHRPSCLVDILKDFAISGINELNSNIEKIGKNTFISLKPIGLHKSKKFEKWLNDELSWSLSSRINTVVYNDDGASEYIAEKTYDFIKHIREEKSNISMIKWKELNKDSLKKSTGIIVVSAFAGDGGTLRQISRDLREFEENTIPRHFLIGVGLPQSMESWIRLEQFLIRNATTRFYNFSAWKVLPLGPDNVKNSWKELIQLASKADNVDPLHPNLKFYENTSECFDAISSVIESSKNSLLPNTRGMELKITDGFVFFNGIFDSTHQDPSKIDQLSQCETLIAISSALQTAREHKDYEKCLRPSNYQSVVISPENFLRFNDGILQACILRASLPSELDYSSDQNLSGLMKEFLYKVFSRHNHPYGDAALEFAAALALGRLKLKKEHSFILVKDVMENSDISNLALRGFLLMLLIN